MKFRLTLTTLVISALVGCAPAQSGDFSLGDTEDCSGVTVVVNFGELSPERGGVCVELAQDSASAKDLIAFAGYETTGTGTYGDQVVCRVNGIPSDSEAFTIEGEAPHLETCADMPPAFAYWALWMKDTRDDAWDYAQEGVGTLELVPGNTIGLVFSTGGETPTPSED